MTFLSLLSVHKIDRPCWTGSVADPWHIGTETDPRIHASDKWIQIRMLLFPSLTFKTPTKNYLFTLSFLLITLFHTLFLLGSKPQMAASKVGYLFSFTSAPNTEAQIQSPWLRGWSRLWHKVAYGKCFPLDSATVKDAARYSVVLNNSKMAKISPSNCHLHRGNHWLGSISTETTDPCGA